MLKSTSVKEAISYISSHNKVFVHGAAATPSVLLEELVHQASCLKDVELIHLHTEGKAVYADPQYDSSFKVTNLFVGSNLRSRLDYNRIDYLPCFLSEIPTLFRTGKKKIDVALLHLSPPNLQGYCSLGVSVDVALAAFHAAEVVVAQINHQMPRVHGDGFIHIDQLDAYIEVDEPLFSPSQKSLTEVEKSIGKNVAALVEDGACLQVGIGAVPDAVLAALAQHKDLGVHSEMWSDGILQLLKSGVVNNSRKKVHAGKTVSGFIVGSRELYDFIHDNPSVIQLGIDYVNSPLVISRNTKVTAINSAIEIDLTGQVWFSTVDGGMQ